MTIALGAFTAMGNVVAADSHEGYGYAGGPKFSVGKIQTFEASVSDGTETKFSRSLIVTGAGDSGYRNHIKDKITTSFEQNLDFTLSTFHDYLKAEMADFYKRHVRPFQRSEWGDLNVSLIVSAQFGQQRRMWVTNKNTITPVVSSVAAVGVGDVWARTVLKGLFPIAADERSITVMAAYAVFMAKERTDGCGMETSIVYAPAKGGLKYVHPVAVSKMEQHFRASEHVERNERMRAMGVRLGIPTESSLDAFLESMKTELCAIDPLWINPGLD
jgi:hypothetical protein